MTTSQARGIKQEGINDASVAEYLQTYPDFFERNGPCSPNCGCRICATCGATVSLVERQVEVLRERNQSLERKLKELVDVARANDALADRIHRLSQRLIRAHTLLETINAVETSLREDFDAMHSVLVLFLEQARGLEGAGRFLRNARSRRRRHQDLRIAAAIRQAPLRADPRCAARLLVRQGFHRDRLGRPHAARPKGELGILAIGASDAERFHPAMSTEFLSRIGELVTYALMR
jgi:uncharacterized protein YigA (DUF484 family)